MKDGVMSKEPQYLFTYGTLMSMVDMDLGRRERVYIREKARFVGRGRFKGRLFDVGACPGAVASSNSRRYVRGELWMLPSRAGRLFQILDRYEGCNPGAREPFPYRRSVESVEHEFGWEVLAWVYVWNRTTAELLEIPSGEWRQREASTKMRPPAVDAFLTAAAAVTRRAA
jgi:gamma-glutamylcyclotransferase (GGCT)/AIG2-like uncharacterized protein YtfP